MKTHSFTLVMTALLALCASSCTQEVHQKPTSPAGHAYVTRGTLEPDKLASIWLIKRQLDKDATFHFVDDGVPLTNGIPFDTPEAEFRRYANLSCYESILKKHAIHDAGVQRMGELIHDIEINYWGEKRFPESTVLNGELRTIIAGVTNHPEACLEKSFAVFDRWLNGFKPSRTHGSGP